MRAWIRDRLSYLRGFQRYLKALWRPYRDAEWVKKALSGEKYLSGAGLSEADLSGADLSGDMNDDASGEVKDSLVPEKGAVAAPDHVANRRVDQEGPQNHKPEHGGEFHPFDKSADDERRSDNDERHLKGEMEAFRDGSFDRGCVDSF